jgi:outer membrane lipoprotein-sorting protein
MFRMTRSLSYYLIFLLFPFTLQAQDAAGLVKAIRAKLDKINDYHATAELKTRIPFLRVPDAEVEVFFKKPDHIKIRNEKGISLVPRESVSISLYSLLNGKYQVIDAGNDKLDGVPVRILKLLPENENADLVLATLYIDAGKLLILKARITTRENGTDEVDLSYGKYASVSLPDRIVFSFNTQDYKMPKGITFDYDDGSAKKKATGDQKNQRGNIEILYHAYELNRGVREEVFR